MILGIIAGSGLYNLGNISHQQDIEMTTPYGNPSSVYKKCRIKEYDLIFLARHGEKHTIPPHKINYKANIWGFKQLGVNRLLSIGATGGISKEHSPGTISILNQIIDLTYGSRESTYFDSDKVVHIDLTEPFCKDMKTFIMKACKKANIEFLKDSVYVCVNGPRLETAAEIKYFSKIGADVVGMTMMPEAALSRELGICFGGLSVVSNKAAGIKKGKLTVTEVIEMMKKSQNKIFSIIENLISIAQTEQKCHCKDAIKDAEV